MTILVLSLVPSPPHLSNQLLSWDKLQHASAYTVLTLCAYLAFSGIDGQKRRIFASLGVAIGFGALVELFQGVFTVSRQADYRDIVANVIGAFTACCAITLLKGHKQG
jgi:VanZ family protein